jgi:uncharacterized protein (DUF58 family)
MSDEISSPVFRRFPFHPKIPGKTTFPGIFRSTHTGQGQEFYSLREYQFGDEARKVHWKTYAKTGQLTVREEIAESNARIWIVCDLSASIKFGDKPVLLEGFSTFIEHLLREGNNFAGCVGYSERIQIFSKPQMGSVAIRSVRDLLRFAPKEGEGVANTALICDFLAQKVKPGDVVFFVSDFLSDINLKKPLSAFPQQELIPVVVRDPKEYININEAQNARISFSDMETGKKISFRQTFSLKEFDEKLEEIFSGLYLNPLRLTGELYTDAIQLIVEWLYKRNKIR